MRGTTGKLARAVPTVVAAGLAAAAGAAAAQGDRDPGAPFVVTHDALVREERVVLRHGQVYELRLAIESPDALAGVTVDARGEFVGDGRAAPQIDHRILAESYREPRPATPGVAIDTGRLPPPAIGSGAARVALPGEYYDLDVTARVLRRGARTPDRYGLNATPIERWTDRVRILVLHPATAAPDRALQAGARRVHPKQPVELQADVCGDGERAAPAHPLDLAVREVQLGLYLPGGGIVPDTRSSGLDPCPRPRPVSPGAAWPWTPPVRSGGFYTPSSDWRDVERRLLEGLRQRGLVSEGRYFGLPAALSARERVLASANDDGPAWRQPIGFFRIDLTADRAAALAARSVEAALPDLDGALTLEPDSAGRPYDRAAPPRIAVDLAGLRPPAAPDLADALGIRLAWIGRGEVPTYVDAFTSESLARRRDLARRGGGVLELEPSALRPGRYEARIVLGDYVLDRADFELGGRGGPVTPFAPREPPVAFEDVAVAVGTETARALGAPIPIRVTVAGGRPSPIEPLGVQLYRKGHFTYRCAWREGAYVGPVGLVDESGDAVLPAPPEPGDYEIHVLRPHGWSRAHLARLPEGQRPRAVGIDFLSRGGGINVELLGRGAVAVAAPALPGAVQIAGGGSHAVHGR